MGCDQCRERCPDEELLLRERQALLRFNLVKAKTLYETFTLLSRSGVLNAKAFEDAVSQLRLCTSSPAQPGLLEQFYSSLQENDGVPMRTLQLLAVLLGSSLPFERATLLFQIYDSDYTLQLSRATVQQLVSEVTHLAVDLVGQLASGEQQVNMQRYFADLKAAKEEYSQARIVDIVGEKTSVSREEFIGRFSGNSACQSLLQAQTLRVALFELRKEQLIKRRAKVPPGLSLTATPRSE